MGSYINFLEVRKSWERQASKKFFRKWSENSRPQIVFRTDNFPKIVVGCPWKENVLPQIDLDNIVNVNNNHHLDNSEKIFRFGQKHNPSFFRLLSTDYKHKLRVVVKKTLTRLKSIIVSVLSKQSYRIQWSIRGNLEVIARNWSYLLGFSISQLNALQSFLYGGKGAK